MNECTNVLDPSLRMGLVSGVSSRGINVNLSHLGAHSGSYYRGGRYGKGEVGEIVLIEGQTVLTIGKITEVALPEKERSQLDPTHKEDSIDGVSHVQILGSVDVASLAVTAGVDDYPRIGDVVYSATTEFLTMLPQLTEKKNNHYRSAVSIDVGSITGSSIESVRITPEKLFGRHCAILGSTGGGKSWTTARIIQQCAKFPKSKLIVLDATGEYRNLDSEYTWHRHLGTPLHTHDESLAFSIPPKDFNESDFLTLFEPSGKVQGPKLRAAIRSLRLVRLDPDLADERGILKKISQSKVQYRRSMARFAEHVDNPTQPFDVTSTKLIQQIQEECHYIDGGDSWGRKNEIEVAYCSSLFSRIKGVMNSDSFASVFKDQTNPHLADLIEQFLDSDKQVLRLCLSNTSYEFNARQILANVIGRKLMSMARLEKFVGKPLLAIVDEAHNFLGKTVGFEENKISLDSFEIIAKEGRKYGLNICLATQRPRDITEGVLSQMGTMIVHRLTNSNDRDIVERACGEADKSIISFLPNLQQGEVTIVGVDFPIPLTIKIHEPSPPPLSDSPSYQKLWS